MTRTSPAALTRRSLVAGASLGLLASRAWAQQPAEVKVGLLVPKDSAAEAAVVIPIQNLREGPQNQPDHGGTMLYLGGVDFALPLLGCFFALNGE